MPDRAPFDLSRVVTVRVPATSANLGPGFDTLGMALTLYNTFTFRFSEDSNFRSNGTLVTSRNLNMAINAALRTAMYRNIELPPLAMENRFMIPQGRGLGSSATAIVGGILAADALLDLQLSQEEQVTLAAEIEGHGDNICAAIYGGVRCIVSDQVSNNKRWISAQVPVASSLQERLVLVAIIPDQQVATTASRLALPEMVSHQSAAFNVGRTALLITALTNNAPELLQFALQDQLHQPYRLAYFRGVKETFGFAQEAGAYGCCLSGSGSTLLAFCPEEVTAQTVAAVMESTLRSHGNAIVNVHYLRIDTVGATVSIQ